MRKSMSQSHAKVWIVSLGLMAGHVWAADKAVKTPVKDAAQKTEQKVQADLKSGKTFAEAVLEGKSGSKTTGTVVFATTDKGLKVTATLAGATPGRHGIHIHEKGDCSAPDATSAGGHFNPTTAPHAGLETPARHAGDLGNITVNQDGTGVLSIDIPQVQGMNDWATVVGKAVVVHEKADDLKTQPSGDSGARISCGVISAAKEKRASL